ncbi:eIF-2-alpha kinase GCN2-like [Dendrobium catenatum]|uniref:eIF-2-alpha kinase GCN2-like n=1 Tax=Dendrobium catenatum TaxID=906689 RepID=UPI00109F3507|nr:eIF-2-alpha kinase GCN2-like [Dendrobium catenatum]
MQIFLKEHMQVPVSEATLMAVGGRYDYLVHQKWNYENRSNPPGAVGTSLAMEKVFHHCSVDIKPSRIELNINVLVCSKGGGGLLLERMELVAELWQASMKAEFVLLEDPSLTEQYEYAAEHDIKFLVIITEAGLTQTGLIKFSHSEITINLLPSTTPHARFLDEETSRGSKHLRSKTYSCIQNTFHAY